LGCTTSGGRSYCIIKDSSRSSGCHLPAVDRAGTRRTTVACYIRSCLVLRAAPHHSGRPSRRCSHQAKLSEANRPRLVLPRLFAAPTAHRSERPRPRREPLRLWHDVVRATLCRSRAPDARLGACRAPRCCRSGLPTLSPTKGSSYWIALTTAGLMIKSTAALRLRRQGRAR
jgi:hypothetical protein